MRSLRCPLVSFSFNDTPATAIYTLSLHDALPISRGSRPATWWSTGGTPSTRTTSSGRSGLRRGRSEEHTSELQSLTNLVCRLLLEKKKRRRTASASDDASSSQGFKRNPLCFFMAG